MNFEEHLSISALAVASLYTIFMAISTGTLNLFAVLGLLDLQILAVWFLFSNFPDVDHRKAKINEFIWAGLVLFVLIESMPLLGGLNNPINILKLLLLGGCVAGLYHLRGKYARDDYEHRQFPHTIRFALIATLALLILTQNPLLTAVGVVSIFSHLMQDRDPKGNISLRF